jgi:antirestriction protein
MDYFAPKIYVACLASYNSGILHSRWINADQSEDTNMVEIERMLAKSPIPGADKWGIHGCSDLGINVSENESIEKISSLAAFIKEHGDAGAAILEFYPDLDDATRAMDKYHGIYSSEVDFATELMKKCYEISNHIIHYIDYQAFAHDIFVTEYLSIEKNHEIHVFGRL